MKTQSLNLENLFKKALFTSFLAVILFHFGIGDGNAQIVLNNSYKIQPGDGYTTVAVDTNGIVEGDAGANRSWNFTGIVQNGSPISASYLLPGSGNGSSNFPGANLMQIVEDSYSYIKTDGGSYYTLGMYTEDVLRVYSNTQKVMEYPFSFNSTFTDTYASNSNFAGTEVRSNGTVTMTADAWGTITLPSGTYPNALRVKTVMSNTDSMFVSGTPFVTSSVSTSYSWYVSGKKFPIFGITYIQSPMFSLKSAAYVTNFTTSISQQSSIAEDYKLEQNFPNPFNPSTTINFSITNAGFTSLKVYDILGKEVASLVNGNLAAGKYSADFDASDLTSGVYFYKLETSDFTSVKKMSLIK